MQVCVVSVAGRRLRGRRGEAAAGRPPVRVLKELTGPGVFLLTKRRSHV
jgi:hypothetical protein